MRLSRRALRIAGVGFLADGVTLLELLIVLMLIAMIAAVTIRSSAAAFDHRAQARRASRRRPASRARPGDIAPLPKRCLNRRGGAFFRVPPDPRVHTLPSGIDSTVYRAA